MKSCHTLLLVAATGCTTIPPSTTSDVELDLDVAGCPANTEALYGAVCRFAFKPNGTATFVEAKADDTYVECHYEIACRAASAIALDSEQKRTCSAVVGTGCDQQLPKDGTARSRTSVRLDEIAPGVSQEAACKVAIAAVDPNDLERACFWIGAWGQPQEEDICCAPPLPKPPVKTDDLETTNPGLSLDPTKP